MPSVTTEGWFSQNWLEKYVYADRINRRVEPVEYREMTVADIDRALALRKVDT